MRDELLVKEKNNENFLREKSLMVELWLAFGHSSRNYQRLTTTFDHFHFATAPLTVFATILVLDWNAFVFVKFKKVATGLTTWNFWTQQRGRQLVQKVNTEKMLKFNAQIYE